jgi:hypothetical protein
MAASTCSDFSKDWKADSLLFQVLEIFAEIFPSLGAFRGKFSKAWKTAGVHQ